MFPGIAVSSFYIHWITFTWKKVLGQWEENWKSQNKKGNGTRNQKQWSLPRNYLLKIKMMALIQNLWFLFDKKI